MNHSFPYSIFHKAILVQSCLFATQAAHGTEAAKTEVAYIQSSGKPSKASQFMAHVIEKPYAYSFDVPTARQSALPESLSQTKVIVLESGDGDVANRLDALTEWVKQGGTLIVLAPAATQIGGESWSEAWVGLLGGGGQAEVSGASLKIPGDPLFSSVKKEYKWMSSGRGLTPLAGAKVVIGTDDAALVSRHSLGKGTVFYFGHDLATIPASDALFKYAEAIIAAVQSGHPATQPSQREPWGYEPLGKPVEAASLPPPVAPRPLPALRTAREAEGAPVSLAVNGRAKGVIILPRKSSRAQKRAAEELSNAVRKIAGEALPVVTDNTIRIRIEGEEYRIEDTDGKVWESAILIGKPAIGPISHRADVAQLPPEGFLIRTDRNLILIAGEDQRPDGMPLNSSAHGVYDFIENQLGVRWLWPGELGTVYPASPTLSIPPLHITDSPALHVRKLRNGGSLNPAVYHTPQDVDGSEAKAVNADKSPRIVGALNYLGKPDVAAYAEKHAVVNPWFRQMKLGSHWNVNFTHRYDRWYTLYSKEHPDWFALQADGTREQEDYRPRLDKQNPGIIQAAAKQLLDYYAENPTTDIGSISPNDGGTKNKWDLSERARKQDPANAPASEMTANLGGMQFSFPYVSLSDRMVGFGNAVTEEVNKLRPNTKVGLYAYANYRTPPMKGPIHPNLVFSFVGTSYFNEGDRKKDRESWDGWTRYGNQIMLRPNALLRGNGFPAVFTTKLAEDVKHCYQTGMFGADYDSVTHNWATRGLNYYLLAKLLWNPALDPEAVIADYCQSGFGPAAGEVRAYFKELEALCNEMAETTTSQIDQELREEEEVGVTKTPARERKRNILFASYPKVYTPERLARLREILAEGKRKAASDPTVLKRIEFVEAGIAFAEHQSAIFAEGTAAQPDTRRLAELIEKRNEWAHQQFEENFVAVSFLGLGDEQNIKPIRTLTLKKRKAK